MTERKGIILAGGTGSRLYPTTMGVSKQLLPVYDKPMIYYPLSVLMLADVRDIAIITRPEDRPQFERLLGDGAQWGIRFTFLTQSRPAGLAEAYLIAEEFLGGAPSAMVLGDNLFFGDGFGRLMQAVGHKPHPMVFAYRVREPQHYGVIAFDEAGAPMAVVEKPADPPSDFALTGLYLFDGTAPERARAVRPSPRGELEITDVVESYLRDGTLEVIKLGRGFAWLDTGTHESLLDAGNFVRTLETRQGLLVGSPDEVAFLLGWIDAGHLERRAALFGTNAYGDYLRRLAREGR